MPSSQRGDYLAIDSVCAFKSCIATRGMADLRRWQNDDEIKFSEGSKIAPGHVAIGPPICSPVLELKFVGIWQSACLCCDEGT
jgi:hypothetical protein